MVGVCGSLLAWIKDYLTNRLQRVVLYGSTSSTSNVTSGVPQGSILGPLLFIVTMDSITNIKFSARAALTLYADDICYYKEVCTDDDCLDVQSDVNAIKDWTETQALRLNATKTKAMLVTRKKKPLILKIDLGKKAIETVSSIKYLGIILSNDLSWSAHINATCCQAKRIIGFLYRHFHLADSNCLTRLYHAIVVPILDYGASIWDPHHTTYIGKLERVQELAAKVATRRWTDDGPNLVKQLTWPSLKMRRQYLKLCLCRRILHGGSLIPPSVFTPHPSSTVRHVNSSPIFLPRVRTNYHRGSYFISTIPLWNNVPDEITSLTSHLGFKKHLKLQLFKC